MKDFIRECAADFRAGWVEQFYKYGGWKGLATGIMQSMAATLVCIGCFAAAWLLFQRGEVTPALCAAVAGAYFFWKWIPRL
jgi:hypothetical protein